MWSLMHLTQGMSRRLPGSVWRPGFAVSFTLMISTTLVSEKID